jgi:hypothetical protein
MFEKWEVHVTVEQSPSIARPRLKSSAFVFELGEALDEARAQIIWNRLGFMFPENAKIVFKVAHGHDDLSEMQGIRSQGF